MIKAALILLREELRTYLSAKGDTTDVILENIALLETNDASNLDQRIIISLVNIEEESTLKNAASNFYKKQYQQMILFEYTCLSEFVFADQCQLYRRRFS